MVSNSWNVKGERMGLLERFGKEEIQNFLNKNWMTHDAMWFYHALREFGIEKTNKINRSAVRSMGAIEAKRIMRAIPMDKFSSMRDIELFFEEGWDLARPRFMDASLDFTGSDRFRWTMRQCFAHDGVLKLGVIEQYECGIYERIKGWLDAMGLDFTVEPDSDSCMLYHEGRCYKDFIIKF